MVWYTKDPTKKRQIDGSFLNFILFINITTFEVLGVDHMVFYLVDNALTFTLKVSFWYLPYIRRITSLERLEPVVFIFLNIAVFVVKLTNLIPENKSVKGRFLQK